MGKRINTNDKGNANERLVKKIMLENGYVEVMKVGGSFGPFDLFGVKPAYLNEQYMAQMAFVQVKTNRNAPPTERAQIKSFFKNAVNPIKKQIWIVYDGHRWSGIPPIKILSYEGDRTFTYFYSRYDDDNQYDMYKQYIF